MVSNFCYSGIANNLFTLFYFHFNNPNYSDNKIKGSKHNYLQLNIFLLKNLVPTLPCFPLLNGKR